MDFERSNSNDDSTSSHVTVDGDSGMSYEWPIKSLPRIRTRVELDNLANGAGGSQVHHKRLFRGASLLPLLMFASLTAFMFAGELNTGYRAHGKKGLMGSNSFGSPYETGNELRGEAQAIRALRERNTLNDISLQNHPLYPSVNPALIPRSDQPGKANSDNPLQQSLLESPKTSHWQYDASAPSFTLPGCMMPLRQETSVSNAFESYLVQQGHAVIPGGALQSVTLVFHEAGKPSQLRKYATALAQKSSVCNFVVVTWTNAALRECVDLHLPCYVANSMLLRSMSDPSFDSSITSAWLKVALVQRAVDSGYAVHVTDTSDTDFPRDVVRSLHAHIAQVAADAAFPLRTIASSTSGNTGPSQRKAVTLDNFMVLPTAGGKKLVASWVKDMQVALKKQGAAKTLGALFTDSGAVFDVCGAPLECERALRGREIQRKLGGMRPLIRKIVPSK